MSALPELAFESTTTLSQEEFSEWVSHQSWDLNHYELLNGRVVMTPPARDPHARVEVRLARIVGSFVHDRGLGECLGSSQGIELPSGDTLQPDFSFVSSARRSAMGPPTPDQFLPVVPNLVVEILSPSTAMRDRTEKRDVYERNGVEEYWLVDSKRCELTVFTRTAGAFDAGRFFRPGEPFRSTVLAGLTVDVGDVLPSDT